MNAPKVCKAIRVDARFVRRMHNLHAFILRAAARNDATKRVKKCLSKWVQKGATK
jgi:hypothetical protein